jgi:hypothetical protein
MDHERVLAAMRAEIVDEQDGSIECLHAPAAGEIVR